MLGGEGIGETRETGETGERGETRETRETREERAFSYHYRLREVALEDS
jgi:hypothetical protein